MHILSLRLGNIQNKQTKCHVTLCGGNMHHFYFHRRYCILKLCLSEDRRSLEEEETRRRKQVVERFQTAPFKEIAAHCGARVSDLWPLTSDLLLDGQQRWKITKYIYCFWVFPFHAALDFHWDTFEREILSFLLHHFYLTAVISQIWHEIWCNKLIKYKTMTSNLKPWVTVVTPACASGSSCHRCCMFVSHFHK